MNLTFIFSIVPTLAAASTESSDTKALLDLVKAFVPEEAIADKIDEFKKKLADDASNEVKLVLQLIESVDPQFKQYVPTHLMKLLEENDDLLKETAPLVAKFKETENKEEALAQLGKELTAFLKKHQDVIKPLTEDLIQALEALTGPMGENAKEKIKPLVDFMIENTDLITKYVSSSSEDNFLPSLLSELVSKIKDSKLQDLVTTFVEDILSAITAIDEVTKKQLKEELTLVFEKAPEIIRVVVEELKKGENMDWDKIMGAFLPLQPLLELFPKLASSLPQRLRDFIQRVIEFLKAQAGEEKEEGGDAKHAGEAQQNCARRGSSMIGGGLALMTAF